MIKLHVFDVQAGFSQHTFIPMQMFLKKISRIERHTPLSGVPREGSGAAVRNVL
jgi:hypothetical protein